MKFSAKNKTVTMIALFLLFAMAVSLFALPTATAQEPIHKKTYAMCGLMPNPVGVNQEVLVWVGITDQLGLFTDGWEGLSVTITKPDGTTETISNIRTDSTGSTGRVYVPTMVGNYTFQTNFPQQDYNWTAAGERAMIVFDPKLYAIGVIRYEASSSPIVTLVVQEEPVPIYPGVPLPTEYWTRPINSQAREWNVIAGNWLNIPPNKFARYNEGPETPHILWAKPLATGGLVGGELGPHAYESGDAYEGKFGDWFESDWGAGSSVIINGVLYYNRFTTGAFVMPPFVESMWKQQGIVAVDLRTGEELWFRNNTRLTFGQVFYWDAWNYHGAFAYLWEITQSFNFFTGAMDNTWKAYDAFSGEFAYGMTNVPSGNRLYGPDGEIYIYDANLERGWVALWNSTKVVNPQVFTGDFAIGSWGSLANIQKTFDARTGYAWNKTIPMGLPGSVQAVFLEDRIIGSDAELFVNRINDPPVALWAVSTKPGQEGQLLFNKTWQPPAGHYSLGFGASSLEDGVFTLWSKEQRAHYGFSLDTGEKLWGPTPSQVQLDIFDIENSIAYGKLFSVGMGGVVYAYDVKTGALVWSYVANDPLNEILWSNNWPLNQLFITDGKIYLGHSEHSPVDPKPRGAPFICLNTTTGEEVWKIDGAFRTTRWGGNAIIADSIIALMDTYDNRIYTIGKGPSATTVTSSPKVSVHGSSVLVEGMVTDISAGTADSSLALRFPNGVPAVVDESMSEWMQYVYMQFPRPKDTVGVEVVLSVLDSNSNVYDIGTATSDANGNFGYTWQPPIPGQYTVYATFAGSKSYWPSYAQTYVTVEEAPVATPAPTPPPAPMTDTYVLGTGTAIIVAIALVGVLLLKKR